MKHMTQISIAVIGSGADPPEIPGAGGRGKIRLKAQAGKVFLPAAVVDDPGKALIGGDFDPAPAKVSIAALHFPTEGWPLHAVS